MPGPFPMLGWGRRATEIDLDPVPGLTADDVQGGVEQLQALGSALFDAVAVNRTLGELYVNDNAAGVGIGLVNEWTRIAALVAGETSAGVAAGGSVLTVTPAGLYAVEADLTVEAAAPPTTWELAIDVDGTPVAKTKVKFDLPTADAEVVTCSGFVRLTGAEAVGAMIRNLTDATDIVVVDCNLKLKRVGD